MELLTFILYLVISIFAIGKGSDWFTHSLIPIAKKLGVSRVSVGLILVSAAVSLPEILVAVSGALKGYPTISLGVVIGSIICNIGLMTGFSALFRPLKVSTSTILRDGIFSIIIPILIFGVASHGEITRIEGLSFFLLFIAYAINVFLQEKRSGIREEEKELQEIPIELDLLGFSIGKMKPGWLSFGLGLVLLLIGAQLFSNQLIFVVQHFGISEIIAGLTLGAIGPSIPNILSSYMATKKGMTDVAVSETLGSNIFTLLVTMGILAMISPITISSKWLQFDIPILIFMSFLLFFFMSTKKTISKNEGIILLGIYLSVLVIQILFFQ